MKMLRQRHISRPPPPIVVGCLLCVLLPPLGSAFHVVDNRSIPRDIATGMGRHAIKSNQSGSCSVAWNTHLLRKCSSSALSAEAESDVEDTAKAPPTMSISEATQILTDFDAKQQAFMKDDGMVGMGGGTSAFTFLTTAVTRADRQQLQQAVSTLVQRAHEDRASDSSKGRIMLGICASNAAEALGGLKSWVSTLALPRGMLHGMDVDGVPIPPEELGSVYVKFSTGGAMTFKQMRESKMGFDALWRPGDALLEPYDGAFRGVYLNCELEDGEFRQFGVLPTDLFMDMEEDW